MENELMMKNETKTYSDVLNRLLTKFYFVEVSALSELKGRVKKKKLRKFGHMSEL